MIADSWEHTVSDGPSSWSRRNGGRLVALVTQLSSDDELLISVWADNRSNVATIQRAMDAGTAPMAAQRWADSVLLANGWALCGKPEDTDWTRALDALDAWDELCQEAGHGLER